MARSIDEIKDIIIQEKNKRLELNELESNSKVSIYNGWAYISAVVIHSFEIILDLFKNDINTTLSTRMNGTPKFYVNEAYKYQDGDMIEISEDGTRLAYKAIDVNKQIITRASYEEMATSGGNLDKLLLIKVAKGETGNLKPLSLEELVRFTSYLENIKFAGTNIQGVSKIGDILIPHLTVFHDGLLPDSIILDRVRKALNKFIETLSFDSALYVSKLYDAISEVENVTDVYADPDVIGAPQGVFIRSFDDDGAMMPQVEVKRFAYLAAGYLRESSKAGAEIPVLDFGESLIIKAELK